MKELSIFIDESGDFGEYDFHSPYYIIPSDYRLFQIADLLCSLQLLELKCDSHILSNSEKRFFENDRTLKKNYIKPLKLKMLE